MAISVEELKRLIDKDKRTLYQMQMAEQYDENIYKEGRYFQYENNAAYDPWYTYIKVFSIQKKSSSLALVISFERNLKNEFKFTGKYKRRIKFLGEEISREEFQNHYDKFTVSARHFTIHVKL